MGPSRLPEHRRELKQSKFQIAFGKGRGKKFVFEPFRSSLAVNWAKVPIDLALNLSSWFSVRVGTVFPTSLDWS